MRATTDGVASIQQPMIEPLFGGKTAAEMVALVVDAQGQESLRHRQELLAGADGLRKHREKAWRKALNDGVDRWSPKPAEAVKAVCRREESSRRRSRRSRSRFAERNRSRLRSQRIDLGRPVRQQRLDAGSAGPDHQAGLGQRGADQSGDGAGAEVSKTATSSPFRAADYKMEAAVMVQPGQADDAVTIALGYGRTQCGRVGKDVGFNANLIRTSDAFWFASGFRSRRTGETFKTRHHAGARHLGDNGEREQ